MIPDSGGTFERSADGPPRPPDSPGTGLDFTDDASPPPPPLPPEPAARRDSGDNDRFAAVVPIMLAALGLVAAVLAWRVGLASNIADDANRAGINAARTRAAAVVTNEGWIALATESFLDYERERRRAEALAVANANDDALLNRMEAAGHWSNVASQYFDRAGQYQPAQERAARLASAEQNADIQPLPHFETADAEYLRLNGLIGAGIVLVFALPFLTLAEIARGRLRAFGVIAGGGIFAAGFILAVGAWL